MIKKLILIAFIFCIHLPVFSQSTVKPERPAQSDMITLTYDTHSANAGLNGKAPVYARVTSYLQDGAVYKFHVRMHGDGDVLAQQFQLPGHAASFKVEFYTLNKDDGQAAKDLMVYRDDHKQPVEGAYMQDLFNDNPDSVFRLEITNYPGNYLAYAKYINVISMIKSPDTAKIEIEKLISKLENIDKSGSSNDKKTGLLAALCVGYAKTAGLNKGKQYLFALLDRYPATAETAFAFSIYNYEYYKFSNKEIESDVHLKLKELFIKYPDAPLSKDENVFHYLQNDIDIPVHAFELALKPLYAKQLVSYHALNNLPEVYMAHNEQLDTAEILLKNAINSFQDGTINHQYRLNNNHYQMYVPFLLLDLVKVNILKKNYQQALINASAAMNILAGSNTEGNFMPLLLPLRAEAFKQNGNLNLAMEDYKKLYQSGNTAVPDSMRSIFNQCDLKQTTFEEFMTALKPGANKSSATRQLAPDFTATDINGKVVHLSDFKGKLVVLNIWDIGCGPCIAEMPQLNELVKEYRDRKDILFLAITADKTENLKKFFKNKRFDYTILNNVSNITEKFNTNAMPVHMIIGREGEIINRSIGARENIKDYLKQAINSQL